MSINQISRIPSSKISSLLPSFFNAQRVPMFVGRPGCAKTAMVREGGKELEKLLGVPHVEVYELHLASMSEVDVRGYLIPDGENARFTKPPFWAAVEANQYGILFLDEFAQATHEVQKAVAPLLLDRRVGDYVLPPGWMVVLASNSIEDNSGANTLLAHVMNRIFYIPVDAPDVDEWIAWGVKAGMPHELLAFAKMRPDVVFQSEVPDAPDTPFCTPRSMEALGRLANAYPGGIIDLAGDNAVGLPLMAAAVGLGAAGEIAGVVRQTLRLPAFEDAMNDPEGTRVPTDLAEGYAMAMLVAVRADPVKHRESAAKYLVRFQPNVALTGIISLIRRNDAFLKSQTFGAWVRGNRELVRKFQKFLTL